MFKSAYFNQFKNNNFIHKAIKPGPIRLAFEKEVAQCQTVVVVGGGGGGVVEVVAFAVFVDLFGVVVVFVAVAVFVVFVVVLYVD